jgi:hypothetical protein
MIKTQRTRIHFNNHLIPYNTSYESEEIDIRQALTEKVASMRRYDNPEGGPHDDDDSDDDDVGHTSTGSPQRASSNNVPSFDYSTLNVQPGIQQRVVLRYSSLYCLPE